MPKPEDDDREQIRKTVQAIHEEMKRAAQDLVGVIEGDPDALTGDNRRAVARLITRLDKITGEAYSLLKY